MSHGWRTVQRGEEHDVVILRVREDGLEVGRSGRLHSRVGIDRPDLLATLHGALP